MIAGGYRSDEIRGKEVTLVRLCILDAELSQVYTHYVVALSQIFGKTFENSQNRKCATATRLMPLCYVELPDEAGPAVVRGIPGPVGIGPAFLSPPPLRDGESPVGLQKFLAAQLGATANAVLVPETFM